MVRVQLCELLAVQCLLHMLQSAVCLPLSHALRGGQNEAVTFDCFREYLCIYAVRVVLSLLPVCVSHFGF